MHQSEVLLDEVLEYKRGSYGPWGLYHLLSGRWAVVWQICLEDERACGAILAEDPLWFNVKPARDGRPANPTYATQHEALGVIIRALELELIEDSGSDQRVLYTEAQLVNAQADLLIPLLDWSMSSSYPRDPDEAMDTGKSGLATAGPFPWDEATGPVKGLSLQMAPPLYAKMKWACENVPQMSMQKIARAGAEAECDRLIELYFKPRKK